MTETAPATDKQMGLAVVFGVLTVIGVVLMYFGEDFIEPSAGWGFGAAIIFGSLAVSAIHLYE